MNEKKNNDSLNNSQSNTQTSLMRGYLKKKGEKNTGWRKRFFILTSSKLSYFKREDDKNPAGNIELFSSSVISRGEVELIIDNPGMTRNYILQADTTKDRNEWVEIIQDVITRLGNARMKDSIESLKGVSRDRVKRMSVDVKELRDELEKVSTYMSVFSNMCNAVVQHAQRLFMDEESSTHPVTGLVTSMANVHQEFIQQRCANMVGQGLTPAIETLDSKQKELQELRNMIFTRDKLTAEVIGHQKQLLKMQKKQGATASEMEVIKYKLSELQNQVQSLTAKIDIRTKLIWNGRLDLYAGVLADFHCVEEHFVYFFSKVLEKRKEFLTNNTEIRDHSLSLQMARLDKDGTKSRDRPVSDETSKHIPSQSTEFLAIPNGKGKNVSISNDVKELIELEGQFTSQVAVNFPNRKLLRSGELQKRNRKGMWKPMVFHLFNDVLMYSEKQRNGKLKHHRTLILQNLKISSDQNNECHFLLQTSGKSFAVQASSATAKKFWMRDIDETIKQAVQLRLKRIETSMDNGEEDQEAVFEELRGGKPVAPVWRPDRDHPACNVCKAKFNMIKRRHHCRLCGAVVCDYCSQNKKRLPNIDLTKDVRVCDGCFKGNKGTRDIEKNSFENMKNERRISETELYLTGWGKNETEFGDLSSDDDGPEEDFVPSPKSSHQPNIPTQSINNQGGDELEYFI